MYFDMRNEAGIDEKQMVGDILTVFTSSLS